MITTASDIFSLGRVLAQLCEADPIFAASADGHLAVGATRLKVREVRAITAKAGHKIPGARYSSAMALAADMERVLAGGEVKAAAALVGYRARKWLGKYAIALAAAAGFVAMAAGFSLQLLSEKKRAEQQAIAALVERDKADAANKLATAARLAAEDSQQQ